MNLTHRVEEIDKELELLYEQQEKDIAYYEKNEKPERKSLEDVEKHFQQDYARYCEVINRTGKKINILDRERRLIMPWEEKDLEEFDHESGSHMTLKEFTNNVKGGGFIDYDGFGVYATKDKRSHIEIYPSDLKYNSIRNDFEYILWFNR